MRTKTNLLGGVAVGVMLAVVATAPVQAKTVKKAAPAASEKEVDELREELQALKDRLDQQTQINQQAQVQVQSAQADAASAKADAAQAKSDLRVAQQQIIQTIPAEVTKEVAANKPKTDKIYYKGITITMGGFAEAASIYRDHDETADISSSFSKIPFANDPASHTGETRFTGRQSRYSILAQGDVNQGTSAAFYGEFDFQGAAQTANSNQSNSYNPRIRNLYATVDWNDSGWHVLGGQNWSLLTLQNNGISARSEVTPPQIDAQYIPGFAWARQPGFRLVKDFNKELWVGVSVEQGQTTLGGSASGVTSLTNVGAAGVQYVTAQAPTNGYFNGTNYSLNPAPDVIGKVAWEKKLGDQKVHIEGFGIYRTFTDRVNYTAAATTSIGVAPGHFTNTATGGGGGGSIAIYDVIPKHLDLQASFFAGNGIGRYGSGGLPDVTVRPDGTLVGIPETMWLAGGTFHANKAWDFYGFAGSEDERAKTYALSATTAMGYGTLPGSNNAGCLVEGGSCSPVTKSIDQYTGGFWWKFYQGPFGRAQFGVQYSYTERKTFADTVGFAPKATENMVFTSFRFYPF
jgi:hypothetical protein